MTKIQKFHWIGIKSMGETASENYEIEDPINYFEFCLLSKDVPVMATSLHNLRIYLL